jgi:hypothetical protein
MVRRAATPGRPRGPTSRFENLNLLRTRRTPGKPAKKESAGSGQSGKGDRWADFNLLRTGRSDQVPIHQKVINIGLQIFVTGTFYFLLLLINIVC